MVHRLLQDQTLIKVLNRFMTVDSLKGPLQHPGPYQTHQDQTLLRDSETDERLRDLRETQGI